MSGRVSRRLSRRRILALVAATAATTLATACGAQPTPTPSPAPTRAPTPAARPSPAATPATSGTVRPNAPSAYQGPSLITGPYEGEAQNLTGAGATFPAVLYTKWFEQYYRLTGVQVNYQSIGSGGGIKSIADQTVDFGATDGPMTDEQMAKAKGGTIFHIPTALGAVAVTYNVSGITGTLKLTGETLAGIFLGQVKKWDDPAIVADNPDLKLPSKYIVVIHRSDGSGTTNIFTDYLSTVSPAWKQKVGHGNAVRWPAGLGAKGNEGVAGEVKQTPNSMGYVELIYAKQNNLAVAELKNAADQFVPPSIEGVTAAAEGISTTIAPDLRASIVNAAGDASYPIAGFTWLLAYESIANRAMAVALTRLLWWCTHEGQSFNADLGYAPLPTGIVARVEEKILLITSGGERAFPHQVTA